MYFAILAPTVTFGGLLGEATENHILVIGKMAVGVALLMAFSQDNLSPFLELLDQTSYLNLLSTTSASPWAGNISHSVSGLAGGLH